MDTTRLKYLWTCYQSKSLSEDEQREWLDIVQKQKDSELLREFLDEKWQSIPVASDEGAYDATVRKTIAMITSFPQQQLSTKRRLLPIYWSAAAAILIMGMAWLFWNKTAPLVLPGTNKASLTLSNGQKVLLDELQDGLVLGTDGLTYFDGSTVIDENGQAKVQEMILQTPRGGQYKIQLSDGTTVFLNADSRLIYPSSFAGKETRRVQLIGEAYFEVAKDSAHPFVVESANQQIKVLGTKFMLSCYEEDESSKTTLLEGAVAVSRGSETIRLSPNEQTIVKGDKMEKMAVDAEEELAWIHGEFVFNKESLGSIMKKLARWYNVEVIFDAPELQNERYEGIVNRFDNMEKVLDMLEVTNSQVKFNINNNRVSVYKTKIKEPMVKN